jgi:hypothetical protein
MDLRFEINENRAAFQEAQHGVDFAGGAARDIDERQ